jgi:hypothetical protein
VPTSRNFNKPGLFLSYLVGGGEGTALRAEEEYLAGKLQKFKENFRN